MPSAFVRMSATFFAVGVAGADECQGAALDSGVQLVEVAGVDHDDLRKGNKKPRF